MYKNKWKFLRNTVLLVWFVICLIIFMYFSGAVNHMQGTTLYGVSTLPEKLSQIPFADYLTDVLISFLGMMFFSIACISLGMLSAGILNLEDRLRGVFLSTKGIILSTYFLIGNIAYSVIFLTLASTSHLSKTNSLIALILGFLPGLFQLKKLSFPTVRFDAGQGKILIILTALILAVSLFQTSARISYDASAVYFSNAKITAIEQQAGYYTENSFVVSVFHTVIQFSALIQIFGDQSARMLTWLFGVLNIAIALALAGIIGMSKPARHILLALIVTSTAFLDLMGDGKVDLISSAYSLMAIFWMVMNMQESFNHRSLDCLSGVFIGFSCIVRPYNVFLLGVFVIVLITQKIRAAQMTIHGALRHTTWMVMGAVGFAVYHLLVNETLLGSPFAFWNSVANINPLDGPWDYQPETIWAYRLFYPVIITFKNSGASLGNISPLVLVFLPVLAVGDIRKHIVIQKEASQTAISAGATLLLWVMLFFTILEVRYVLFLWIILFIPFAEIIAVVFKTNIVLLQKPALWAVILLMGYILFRSAYVSISTYSPVDDLNNPNCIDNILCGHFAPINKMADQDERVLTLSAFRYYLRTDLFACSTTVEEYGSLKALSHSDSEAFWREVNRLGYSYVAFEKDYTTRHLGFSYLPFIELPEWVILTPIIVASEDLQIVAYEFNTLDSTEDDEIICRQDEIGAWRLKQK